LTFLKLLEADHSSEMYSLFLKIPNIYYVFTVCFHITDLTILVFPIFIRESSPNLVSG
jgi:hypothetical protein